MCNLLALPRMEISKETIAFRLVNLCQIFQYLLFSSLILLEFVLSHNHKNRLRFCRHFKLDKNALQFIIGLI